MNKLSALKFIALLCFTISVMAAQSQTKPFGAAITFSKNAKNIARIANDSLVLIKGTTYRFTVDTPEDKGLISTGIAINDLASQLIAANGAALKYLVTDKTGVTKTEGEINTGDRLKVMSPDGAPKIYHISVEQMALSGCLSLVQAKLTANTIHNLTINFTAGQRSPDATVKIYVPAGINVTMENTTVNVIGRGDVKLSGLAKQSIGRTGTKYSYSRVGNAAISGSATTGSVIILRHLDLRPANGADLEITIGGVNLKKAGKYLFKATYTTSKPQILTSPGTGAETATLIATRTVLDLVRVPDTAMQYRETPVMYTKTSFKWGSGGNATGIQLQQSVDKGKTWSAAAAKVDLKTATASVSGLIPHNLYLFRLKIGNGAQKGFSNVVSFYSGKMDIREFGITGNGTDDTEGINRAIAHIHELGGGTLLFTKGIYPVRTVHLMSNVFLYLEKDAVIKGLKGGDEPEATWFSDRKYRSGLSPTDAGPYADPENYMTKQDVGHHYFKNAMFAGERLDNVKIIGSGQITGDGSLVNGDKVMNNAPGNRCDKMFSLKLCTRIEIGGIYHPEDLWYDETKDEPYYIGKNGEKIFDSDHMLKLDRSGHFALLATGTDGINIHDTYISKNNQTNVRDVYDFMECNKVTVTNIFSRVSSDDVVKPGSDCSLGFTRPASNYMVRNIIGDTNCNLIQIGSETADDITDVYVDNIYVLGANKAGFSISTNDGAHVRGIYLNSGRTGPIRERSRMYRATSPFFISISNRGRVIGAEAGRYVFTENGKKHDELLIKNVNIGEVENISLKGLDVFEVYGGSSYNGKRWKPYDGTQRKATPIIAGYKLPDAADVAGGLDFKLPNGEHTGYIKNVMFDDVHFLVKGGNPLADTANVPPELGVGQYNVADLKVQPSYGLWARHVNGLTVNNCTFNYEKRDSRYALFLDDVTGAKINAVKAVRAQDNPQMIGFKSSRDVQVLNSVWYNDTWGNKPAALIFSGKEN
ncbi:endopygalactorunase [Mucilaginibacter pocheonensis]|uniref:Polygalacturonase n=1 Tax=Mucilaginibacter pocheonensis TaxID=398050 RepID=A0ABU1T6W9_9SPHI|nr:endopygalactorunase [Mucilaginibacter pocheonensis]MDR6941127.1 polygalacturonase [Mucilaginibacter pocheonensis]